MAKKSTKTAHVLNLISKSTEQDPTTQTEETQASEQVQHPPTSPLLSSLKETAKNEQLSDTIKDNLMAELLEEEAENAKTATETTTPQEPITIQTETADIPVSEPVEPVLTEEPTVAEPVVEPTISAQPVSEKPSAPVQEPNDTVQTQPETEEPKEPEEHEDEFHFVNVGEMLIKDKVMEYMERFDVCTCSRCVADTMAIALSNLTPKYVVSDDSDVVPFLSYYESKFTNQIMTELTKACLAVDANPRHKTKS